MTVSGQDSDSDSDAIQPGRLGSDRAAGAVTARTVTGGWPACAAAGWILVRTRLLVGLRSSTPSRTEIVTGVQVVLVTIAGVLLY